MQSENIVPFRTKVEAMRWRCPNCQISFVRKYDTVCQPCWTQLKIREEYNSRLFHRPFTVVDALRIAGIVFVVVLMFLFLTGK
jgi:transposase-like protein